MTETRLVADRPVRLRPRDGSPRCVAEVVAQWAWRWRVELALAWIVVSTALSTLHQAGIL